ncbi:hypothetical protein ACFSLT_23810 [Novosphingobium resinovorum]
MRRHYGQRSFDYGTMAASGSLRHGLSKTLTAEGHFELSGATAVLGVGAVVRIGTFGVVNAAYGMSRNGGRNGDRSPSVISTSAATFPSPSITSGRMQASSTSPP